ncbi:mitochondrial basic amino acids transporter-like isoform X2 [Xiphophorus hellerii]|uniref:mitochondrial basic amino acids transporter-like isoform X2 n=1 Tax=Xiphophorus hellerii TaxID=8084 RepID=UPI0013B38C8A|nr:mitochondrial basic amino acids transporter-like isoform X2 [Xiphophorus hellerii]
MMDFVAGCIGGAAGVLVGHPFDTVKIRLQVQKFDNPLYRGTFHCFKSIIRQESGNAMRLLGEDTPTHQFITGAAAGTMQSVICCPMELAKTRMQMQGTGQKKWSSKNLYKNSLDCLLHIYRREGLPGIYRGMVTTLVREAPGFGVYFWTYAVLTQSLGCEPSDTYMIPKLLFSGGMAGITSWIVIYPVDVIKSRLQADGVGGVNQYSSIADCVRQSVRKEGYMVFTRGLTSTVLRAFPMNAATFATVSLVLMYARGEEEGPED